jgi:hypothetical protein
MKFTHRSFSAKFEDWFAGIDVDGSGTLDFDEIYDFVLQALGLHSKKQVKNTAKALPNYN